MRESRLTYPVDLRRVRIHDSNEMDLFGRHCVLCIKKKVQSKEVESDLYSIYSFK